MTTDTDQPQASSSDTFPSTGDPGILARLHRRDRETQTCVYLTHRPSLLAVAKAILDGRADATQLVTDVFTDFFFRHVDGIRNEEAVPAYLRMMTIRRARQPSHGLDECLHGLSEKPRRLMKLHFGHELSFAEIGEQLGISPRAAGKGTIKALKQLQTRLHRQGLSGPDERT